VYYGICIMLTKGAARVYINSWFFRVYVQLCAGCYCFIYWERDILDQEEKKEKRAKSKKK
jgi:hypothetical protein